MAKKPAEEAATSRDMAKRARRLANTFVNGPDKTRLLEYATELEEQADKQEAAALSASKAIASPLVTRPQQQVQQQEATEPTPDPAAPKPKV